MKRIGIGLFEKIIDMGNLRLADKKAQLCKKSRPEVIEHNKHKEEDLQRLHEALRDKTYVTSEYRKFIVHEPKEREIASLPFYPDRIVHHAIMNVLEPVWRKIFTYNSYACIKGLGIKACTDRTRRIIDGYHKRFERCYCLKIDIRKFYPSVDHEVLKAIVRGKIKCKDTLWLLDSIIDSSDGLPIGNYISQYIANLYLSGFMHWMTDGLKTECVEYCDDIVFFSSDKRELHKLLHERIEPYMKDVLGLEVKDNWQVFPIATNRYSHDGRSLDFMGYTFYMEHTGIRKRVKKKFARRVSEMRKEGISGKRLAIKASAWTGWCKHGDCKHLTKTIMKKETRYVRHISNVR